MHVSKLSYSSCEYDSRLSNVTNNHVSLCDKNDASNNIEIGSANHSLTQLSYSPIYLSFR